MKRILDPTQRKGLASALYSLGNIVAAALIIGQMVGTTKLRMTPLMIGLILSISTYLIATKLNREGIE